MVNDLIALHDMERGETSNVSAPRFIEMLCQDNNTELRQRLAPGIVRMLWFVAWVNGKVDGED
jgi:hypothetical protein